MTQCFIRKFALIIIENMSYYSLFFILKFCKINYARIIIALFKSIP